MEGTIQALHSAFRWIVVLLVIATLIKSALGLATNGKYADIDKKLMGWMNMSLAVQFLIGLVLLIIKWIGPYADGSSSRGLGISHAITMFVAILVGAIGGGRARRADDDRTKFGIQTLATLIAMAVIYTGVAIVGGW